jgi:hypothetical protein
MIVQTQATAIKTHVVYLLRDYPREAKLAKANSSAVKEEEKHSRSKVQQVPHETGAVLSLYGHAHNTPYPRQVFSSLQQLKPKTVGTMGNNPTTEVFTPIRDLPNGITSSNTIPLHPPEPSDTKKIVAPTFAESFGPPPSIPSLNPPPQSRHTTTRGLSVNWYNSDDAEPTASTIHTSQGTRTNYKQCHLRPGQWLRNSATPVARSLSPEAKRIHIPDQSMSLFRRAYGGVAPSRDNSVAIIPENLMDHVWWEKTGEQRFDRYFIPSNTQDMTAYMDEDVADDAMVDEDKVFAEAVENWKPDEPPKGFEEPTEAEDSDETKVDEPDKTAEELLGEISECLETLSSYQRNRNLSLAPTSRTSAKPSGPGNTADPSTAEFDMYETLKTSLTLMVDSLPPHVVARLDGDQLKDLNISTNIILENANYKGTMEEDEYSIRVRELSTATSTVPRPSTSGYGSTSRAPSYQSSTPQPNQRSGYITQPPTGRPNQNYQPQLNYPGRPTSSTQYSSSQPQSFPNRQTQSPSTSQRPPFPPSQYSQSGSSQYGPARPVQNGYHSSPPNGTPAPPQSYGARPPQPNYGQQSPGSTHSTPAVDRSASPQKPPSYTPASPAAQRNSYAVSANSNAQPRYAPQPPHHPSQYGQYAQVKSPGASMANSGDSSLASQMVAAQQAIMNDRPRQAIAPQTRQGSGTPQPPNGQHVPERTATPGGGQQNGTAATATATVSSS